MYYVELTNYIQLLKYLVISIQMTYIFSVLISRFTLIDSYGKKIYLCI